MAILLAVTDSIAIAVTVAVTVAGTLAVAVTVAVIAEDFVRFVVGCSKAIFENRRGTLYAQKSVY